MSLNRGRSVTLHSHLQKGQSIGWKSSVLIVGYYSRLDALSMLYRLTGNCKDLLSSCRKRQRNRQRTKNNEAGLHKVPPSVEGRILSSDEDVQRISAGHLRAHARLGCCTVLHRAFRQRTCQNAQTQKSQCQEGKVKSMCPHSAVQCHARRLRSVCMHVVLCGTHGDTVKFEGLLTGTLLSNIGEGTTCIGGTLMER